MYPGSGPGRAVRSPRLRGVCQPVGPEARDLPPVPALLHTGQPRQTRILYGNRNPYLLIIVKVLENEQLLMTTCCNRKPYILPIVMVLGNE